MPDPARPPDPAQPPGAGAPADPPGRAEETSLAGLVDRLVARGYRCQLLVQDAGMVRCPEHGTHGPSSDLTVDAARRFEGMSDPDDMALVAAVRWTSGENPACRGVLVLTFGPMAPPEHQAAIAGLSHDHRRPGPFI